MLGLIATALQGRQPPEAFEPDLGHFRVLERLAAQKHRMWKGGVAIGQAVFEPAPRVRLCVAIETQEPSRQLLLDLTDAAISSKALQVLMNANQGERPSSRAAILQNGQQGLLEQLASQTMDAGYVRMAKHHTKCP